MGVTVFETPEKLALEIDSAFDKLIHSITTFDEKQFNTIPFEGSWTAGQVVSHIIKSVAKLPDQNTQSCQRVYNEKVVLLKKLFLDFGIKMESPEFIIPEHLVYDKTDLIIELKSIQNSLVAKIKQLDLTALCMDYEFPTFGYLTRHEWLSFFVFHIQRHTMQIKNIYQCLSDLGI